MPNLDTFFIKNTTIILYQINGQMSHKTVDFRFIKCMNTTTTKEPTANSHSRLQKNLYFYQPLIPIFFL